TSRSWPVAASFRGFVLLPIDPHRLMNPNWSIRNDLPDVLFERSRGLIRSNGYEASADGKALLIYLQAEGLTESLPYIKDVIENTRVLDNDLRPAVVAAVQRPGGYDIVTPRFRRRVLGIAPTSKGESWANLYHSMC